MIRYCDECKKSTWPKSSPSYMFWGKCIVCGKITWLHEGADHLYKKKGKEIDEGMAEDSEGGLEED